MGADDNSNNPNTKTNGTAPITPTTRRKTLLSRARTKRLQKNGKRGSKRINIDALAQQVLQLRVGNNNDKNNSNNNHHHHPDGNLATTTEEKQLLPRGR